MPSPGDLILDFDDAHEALAANTAPTGSEEDPWGFEKALPKIKKKNRSKKKNVPVKPVLPPGPEDDDSSAYPTSITPSPPGDAVKPQPLPPATDAVVAPPAPRSPLSGFEDDTTAVEDVEPLPSPKPLPKLPTAQSPSPAVKSPRPAPAQPVVAPSPPARPASLYGQHERSNSLTAYRQAPQPRRESFVHPASPRPRFVEPPPPHMPQPHFFGLPDLGFSFGQKQESGRLAGSDGYCCLMDSLADAGDETSARKGRDALLVGSEGGLDVFRILPNKLEVVGRLEGLRGSVIGAKILPQTNRHDSLQQFRPLIALIIHGPVAGERGTSARMLNELDGLDGTASAQYQTTVEIYTLQIQQHLVTLYASTPVAVEQPVLGQVSSLPGPVGDLSISAEGPFITVASGKSGELFVFTATSYVDTVQPEFRCVGKFWTSVQTSSSPSRPTTASDGPAEVGQVRECGRAIYSLSQRWLAITPPAVSSTISIQGTPTVSPDNRSPPGIATHVAPPQPAITCEVVGTDVEGTWTRLGKAAAQGLVKYSQKGIEMGLQGWKELTHPSPPSSERADRASGKDDLFPPTKGPGEDPVRLTKEPAVVCILDLESLLRWEEQKPKYAPAPMASFALLDGCNFLSLSATGTRLLTSSRKGEVATVWDLAQVAHGVSKLGTASQAESVTSPCVKQLHRIPRNTPSTVLGCAWSRDDDALALLTAHGTVHLHEVPTRPGSRKRKRRSTMTSPVEKAEATVSLSTGLSPPSSNQGFLGSIKSGWQTVSTQVNTIRSTNPASALGIPTTFAGFREATAAAGTAGSRVVAKGLSHGYTAAKGGASDYWHADENKIRHKALQDPTSASSMRFIRRNSGVSLAIVCGGIVYTHHIQRVTRRKGDDIVSGLKHERYAQKSFALPRITTKEELGTMQCAGQGPHGFWSLRRSTPPPHPQTLRKASSSPAATLPLHSQANDVETNPPYCPFHADPRAHIWIYGDAHPGNTSSQLSLFATSASCEDFLSQGHARDDEDPWTFGHALPVSSLVNERVADEFRVTGARLDMDDSDDDDAAGVTSLMESKLTVRSGAGAEIRINTQPRAAKMG